MINVIWPIVSIVANICSIIALPIAVWQIVALKRKVEHTERGIEAVLEIKEHDRLTEVRRLVETQYTEIYSLISLVGKSGKDDCDVMKKCRAINKNVTSCIVNIPPQYKEIMSSLKKTMENIEEYVSKMEDKFLKDARDYLNNAMQGLKSEEKHFDKKSISLASK